MSEKRRNTLKEIGKTILALCVMFIVGIAVDIFYKIGSRYWSSWGITSWLVRCNITYTNAFDILRGNFGVIVAMFSMLLTMNNNIFERLEKKIYGIPRADLYPNEGIYQWIYLYVRRMCLLAPLLMILFLNLKFCLSGYLVFLYSALFLLWYYYRHISSFSKPLDEATDKLKSHLPKEGTWTADTLSEYQILLENIGRSAEEDGNWKEMEILYNKLCEVAKEYDLLKHYLIVFYFYRTVFWKREKRSRFMPMKLLRTYLNGLDSILGGCTDIPEKEWPVLYAMLCAAVCEANEDELVKFLQWFYNYSKRSGRVLESTGEQIIQSEVLDKQAGVLILLLEYRVRMRAPESRALIEQLKNAWNRGKYAFEPGRIDFISKIQVFNQETYEDDCNILETAIHNLREDYTTGSHKSLMASLVLI